MMYRMRTTLTLDPDVEALVKRSIHERGITFKAAVNDALRRGLADVGVGEPYRLKTFDLGEPLVSLVKALQLAGEMEDEAIVEKMRQRR